MPDSAACIALPCFHLHPPYKHFGTAIRYAELPRERFGPGSILAVGLDDPGHASASLSNLVPRLRRDFLGTPVILRLMAGSAGSAGSAVQIAHEAGPLQIRAIISDGQPIATTLRPALSRPADLAHDVVEWLDIRGTNYSPNILHLIHEIVRHSSTPCHLADILTEIGISERTARSRFRKKALPAPNEWLDLARGLRNALRIQDDEATPLLALALDLGYCDHSGLGKHLRRLFDTRSQEVRQSLGWEWMLHRWANKRLPSVMGSRMKGLAGLLPESERSVSNDAPALNR